MESSRDKIFSILKQLPNINQAQLEALVQDMQDKKGSLTKALIEKGIVSENELLMLLVREMKIPSIDLSKFRLDKNLKFLIPEKLARNHGVLPFSTLGDSLTVVLSDPFNVLAIDEIRNLTGKMVDVVLASQSQVARTLDQLYSNATDTIAKVTDKLPELDLPVPASAITVPVHYEEQEDHSSPVTQKVNSMIKEAISQKASDIHMEPSETGMRVRYRIDGILQDILTIPVESQNAILVRIKIMARIDITSFQLPQDGRFKMRLSSGEIDFRVSLLPTIFGQKIVIRILDKNNLSIGLGKLGFSTRSIEILENAIHRPFGMILVTGPTGSGKSTTLYSLVNQLNTTERNIVTIEDPVEYLVDGLSQIEIRPDIGFSFASGLKSVLRQSPDIVMVGEIRDNETADIAIKASLTGQLVLSTLHTNDAAGALTRLIDMGLEPFLVASSLLLVCAQRLCRRICPHCKETVQISEAALTRIKHKIKPGTVFYKGKGCDRCRQTGYSGRLGVTEVLLVDDQVRELLLKGEPSYEITCYAQEKQGMKLLFDDCLDKMIEGETTLEEVLRITSVEEMG